MNRRVKRLQDSLDQQSETLRTLVENLPDGVFLKDREGRFVFANQVIAKMMGAADPSALVGKTDHDFYPQELADAFSADERAVMQSRRPLVNREESGSALGQSNRLTTKVPLLDAHGEVTGLLGITRDITERHEAEAELKRSEARYRSLFQHMMNGFAHCRMIFDNDEPTDFVYLKVNSSFETLTGLRGVEGKRVTEVIPGIRESNPELFETYGRVALAGAPERLETYVPELKIWFSISVFCPQKGDFVAIFDNITDRKRLEASLEKERILLLTLINSLPDFVYVKDNRGRYVLGNQALADFVRVKDPSKLIGRTDYDFHPGELADKYVSDDRRVIKDEVDLVNMEEPTRSASGEVRWLLTTKVPIRGESGAVTGLVGSSHDITQRKLTEQKLRDQSDLLDFATDAILVRDLRNRIIYWNRSAARMFGWNREEALGRDVAELLFPAHPEEPLKVRDLVTEKGEWSGDLHPRTMDGRDLTVESRCALVRDLHGTPTAILSVNSDVTERRAIQSQLLRVQRLESLGTLAGGIAHDLNNVLSPILMGVEGLSLHHGDETSRKILDIIKSAALRGAAVVRQVLSFARGAEGDRTEVQLKHVLREVETIIKETFPKSVDISTAIPKDLPPVIADATQIHQVLMNLCVNARDAMPNGGRLTLSVEGIHLDETYAQVHVEARPIDYVVLKVEDTGMGIAPAVIEKIFDPFFTTKDPGKGTGLGLATTRTIVKSHGGFINVYSEVGKGSSFTVYLPVAVHASADRAESISSGIPMGDGELILVVDDEAAVREIARQILESYGYRAITARDGAEAVEIFAQRKREVRVVITDMEMPHMDGAATAGALRKIEPGLKIIATSGMLVTERSRSMTGLGIQEFISKPYSADTLLETLKRVLESVPRR